jgi:hypothetical protein
MGGGGGLRAIIGSGVQLSPWFPSLFDFDDLTREKAWVY